jgi:hypothetical protein
MGLFKAEYGYVPADLLRSSQDFEDACIEWINIVRASAFATLRHADFVGATRIRRGGDYNDAAALTARRVEAQQSAGIHRQIGEAADFRVA